MSMRRCFCSIFNNFGPILAFHALNIRKNCLAWAERYANIISNLFNSDSTIIQSYFLHCFNVFISCWRAEAISTTSSRPSLNRLYHNWTCVLLIVDFPNTTVNISNALAQNLIQFLWSIVSNSKNWSAEHDWPFYLSKTKTDNPKWLTLSTYI